MTVKQIIRAVSKEAAAFRRETKKLPASKVYSMAYTIYIVEEIVYLITGCQDFYDDDDILPVLSELCAQRQFLSEFRVWSLSLDSIDMSNTDKSLDTLYDFCRDYKERGGCGGDENSDQY